MGNAKNLAFWAVVILLLVALFSVFQEGGGPRQGTSIPYSDFLERVENGQVSSVVMDGERITGRLASGAEFQTIQPGNTDPIPDLRTHNVEVRVEPQQSSGLLSTLGFWLPMLILIGVWIFFLNRMQGGARGGAMGFGKSKAKLLTERSGKVTFDDVAGIDEAKEELEEIVEFLKDPQKYSRLGGKIPKGALLVGPPGTG
ncbi:MAG: ATP-dependent metallopeptidase FtsH/Yme1/Tma family protein, partial [Planctomycetota bacterium]